MRIVDLSLPITNAMRGVSISAARRLETDGWNASTLELYSHCGTHMDAPFHFLPGGATLEQQDLSVCVGDAVVLDLTATPRRGQHTIEQLAPYKQQITAGCRLLFRTDWHKEHGTEDYRNCLPRISNRLAEWLVEREVAMVGVEGPSVADVNNRDELTEVHQTLFRGGVLIVEALANLDQLTQAVVQFIGLPLHLPNGDGSPIRAIAIER